MANFTVDFFFQKGMRSFKKEITLRAGQHQTDGVCAFATFVETAESLSSLGEQNC